VRLQYRGLDHGRSPEHARFNPEGITYVDKLWGSSRDVLSQELSMPPRAVVPCHAHEPLGAPPDGNSVWQAYYVWEGRARVHIGRSLDSIEKVDLVPGDVLLYPNGVAHKVVAGEEGARYVFLEKRARGDTGGMVLEEEAAYERKLTSRLDMDLETFIGLEERKKRP
jgi:mannose-6-phosphate isomerase-like protein (cupin superfamily)